MKVNSINNNLTPCNAPNKNKKNPSFKSMMPILGATGSIMQWIESKGYYCNYLNKSYSNSNYQRKDKVSISEEVLITNYPVNWRNE